MPFGDGATLQFERGVRDGDIRQFHLVSSETRCVVSDLNLKCGSPIWSLMYICLPLYLRLHAKYMLSTAHVSRYLLTRIVSPQDTNDSRSAHLKPSGLGDQRLTSQVIRETREARAILLYLA